MSSKVPDRVFVCSRLRGDDVANTRRAKQYCYLATTKGVAPFAPHIHYPLFLDDNREDDRCAGIAAGKAFLLTCKEVWAFIVEGVISTGMKGEIELAIENDISVRWFSVEVGTGYTDETGDTEVLAITELSHLPHDRIPSKWDLMPAKTYATEANNALQAMAKSLAAGKSYSGVSDELDQILGTSMAAVETDLDEAWEMKYRGGTA